MKTKLLLDGPEKVYAVVFDPGDEVMAGLLDFARARGLDGGDSAEAVTNSGFRPRAGAGRRADHGDRRVQRCHARLL